MRTDLAKRLEALEKAHNNDGPELWIDKDSSTGVAGWEICPQNDAPSECVHRLPGESDDDLRIRARECMERLRREGGRNGGARIYFAFDEHGVTQ
ncbi:hypothetical protein NPJ88_006605 [Halomonas elongata]|uniref:hypothetical protein n=1 Tax=Halomonas elongata TaxID=2746 RepID=UPI00255AC58A|nr:hypothetical protein [Halomonas elongata]MDL4861997.1 hypothetical protein [Halomonas elongata]